MKNDADHYKQVEQEIKEGKFQEGLTTRAIAETDGDENKARALYIKLRIESLKKEAIEKIHKAKEQELKAKEFEKQERLTELIIELENLASVSQRRRIFAIRAICGGFTIGIVFGIVLVVFSRDKNSDGWLGVFGFFGGVFAFLGYVTDVIYRNCSPAQRYLYKIRNEMNEIKNEIRYSKMSPIRRLVKRWGWNLLTVFYVLGILSLLFRSLGLIK
jgi:hypothetical protein